MYVLIYMYIGVFPQRFMDSYYHPFLLPLLTVKHLDGSFIKEVVSLLRCGSLLERGLYNI